MARKSKFPTDPSSADNASSALTAFAGNQPHPLQLIRKQRLARLLDVSGDTLERWVAAGRMPAPTKLGSGQTKVWQLAVIQRWLGEQFATPTESGPDAA